jgi:ribosomal protein L40E
MAVVIFVGITFCLTPILGAVILYFIPTYFGLKSKPKLAVVGLVFLVILGLTVGLTAASAQDGLTPQSINLTNEFSNGQVAPFRSSAGITYSFTVDFVDPSANATPNVQLRLLDTWSGADTLHPMTHVGNTTEYIYDETLGESVYFYAFVYTDSNGTAITTDWGNGPVTAISGDIYSHNIGLGLLIVFYLVGVLFYMLIVLTWWMDSSKKKFDKRQAEAKKNMPQAAPAGASKKEKFVCSECGAEVPADSDKCPHCGEKFDEEGPKQKGIAPPPSSTKAEEFVCSECGKTVKASDTKCWNCGKEFDE